MISSFFSAAKYQSTITVVNAIVTMIAVLLIMVLIAVIMQMKSHTKRMGWFLAAVLVVLGGITSDIMGDASSVYDAFNMTNFCYIRARIFYAFMAPLFSLYFIETEREDGAKWDGQFWFSFNSLIALALILQIMFDENSFICWLLFLLQYVVIIGMLLFSSKSIKNSIGFILGSLFPITVAIVGMTEPGFRLGGMGLVLMLIVVLFIYQADMERELLVRDAELSDSKVSLLMDQIHPHFIYNSLQQIALLCDDDKDAVKPALLNFSGYLRQNLESLTDVKMIPFEKEMEHVDMFIELARISQSKYFEVVKEFETTDFFVPAITVQPLVENAIKYGVGMSTEGSRVVIETKIDSGFIIISVSDDGHGKKTELKSQKDHKSVGTKNVMTRLKLLCDGELSINPGPEGTVSTIKIPLK